MLVVAAVTSLYPIAIDYSFNALNKKINRFNVCTYSYYSFNFLKGISYFYQTVVVGKISNSIIKVIQLRLYEKIVNFDVLLINEFKQGSLQSRFINDLNILREAITRVLNNLIRDFFTLLGLLISMFYLDWVLSFVCLLIYPLALNL